MRESQTGEVIIPHHSYGVFRKLLEVMSYLPLPFYRFLTFLQFLYFDTVDMEPDDAVDLLPLADGTLASIIVKWTILRS